MDDDWSSAWFKDPIKLNQRKGTLGYPERTIVLDDLPEPYKTLLPILGYATWEKFYQAITRALVTCKSTGQAVADHFRGTAKMVKIGSKTRRKIQDYHLSRLACYLIAQNGDPRKPEIAFAQTYGQLRSITSWEE